MNQPTLFQMPFINAPSKQTQRRDKVKEWKKKYRIFTDNDRSGQNGWLALSMDECCEALKGHGLSEEEKTDGVALMAGYCRLLDEGGFIEDNHRTEYEACEALVKRIEK